ncbi:unnamed protein product [Cuscuta campestris]|uniref:HIT-type domain-containing protein n=1 Tax=Cuscuta campestris TaxID=132261 RepID=A0A484NHD5_9ASTE|nr:unnamed protein product [Cuscuta campestris]
MGQRKCGICEEAQFKYKCPICVMPYCSLACFKKHKEIPCEKPISSSEGNLEIPCEKPISSSEGNLASVPPLHIGKPMCVDEPREELNQSQLESIASSSEICEALRSEELRKLIWNIDSSPEAENELEKAMQKEEFCVLTQKILSIINR